MTSPDTSYSTPLISLDAVAVDTETTGLDARVARLVQIGGVRIRQGALNPDDRFESLVNPGVAIPKIATTIHGISNGMVETAPKFADIAAGLETFIGSSIVVGHTIYYDLAVIDREYSLAGRKGRPDWRGLDIRMLARLASPSLADYSLERLCDWLGIELKGRHTAMGDAQAAGRVFLALIPLLRDKNIRTLAEAQAASRALAEDEARSGTGFLPERPRADQASAVARIDSFPYRYLVRDIMSAPALFAEPDTILREAVRLLIERRVSSLFVRAPSGETGIVTERDVLRAIHEGGEQTLAARIDTIMKAPLQTVAADAFLYRAIGRIERLGFRHLGVTDDQGNIVGAVTTRNLLRHRAATAIMLGDEIESATSDAGLGAAFAKLPLMARKLMEESVDPRTVSAVVSSEICSMTRRAAQLAEQRLAAADTAGPPVPYAVMVLGSAGRGESQLAADQDNAIVYAEGKEGGPEDTYFEKLAREMNGILDAAGVPLCKGGVMARNREWRKSAADWRATIESWVRRQRPQDLLNVDIFFDALPVHGDAALAESIWNHAYECGHAARDFQNILIETTRDRSSALSMFGNFKLNERGRIDLKKHGLMPIFTAARVLSIRHDVRARSTRERLEGVAARGVGSPEFVQTINDAHRFILGTVIAQQLADTEAGVPASAHVLPQRLDKASKAELKEALHAAEGAVDLASEGRL